MTEILKAYTQKSRIFLYPLLGIPRNAAIIPTQTYMSWNNVYKIEDCKLICLYTLRDDYEFKSFEKNKLSGNRLMYDFKFTEEDGKGVFIFDITTLKINWQYLVSGKYSKLSKQHKDLILLFFKNSKSIDHIESFLYPDKYFETYAKLLGVKESVLREVGELCPIPDFDKENLKVNIKNLDIISSINTL